jgi:hypothetical protein
LAAVVPVWRMSDVEPYPLMLLVLLT